MTGFAFDLIPCTAGVPPGLLGGLVRSLLGGWVLVADGQVRAGTARNDVPAHGDLQRCQVVHHAPVMVLSLTAAWCCCIEEGCRDGSLYVRAVLELELACGWSSLAFRVSDGWGLARCHHVLGA